MRSRHWRIVVPIIVLLALALLEKYTRVGRFDASLIMSLQEAPGWLKGAAMGISYATQVYVVLPAYFLAHYLKWGKQRLEMPLLLAFTEALVISLKFAFAIPRPVQSFWGYGFPSGHSARTFFVAFTTEGNKWKIPLFTLALLTCASRAILGAHTLMDLVGGALLAYSTSEVAKWRESS